MHLEQLEMLVKSGDEHVKRRAVSLLHHFQRNMNTKEIADELNISVRQVQRYIENFREEGIDSCRSRPRGRKPNQAEKLRRAKLLLVKSPQARGFLPAFWTPDMLSKETGLSYKSCYQLFSRSGLGCPRLIRDIEKLSGQRLTDMMNNNKREQHVWWVHHFRLGDDRALPSRFAVHLVKHYHVFLLWSLTGHRSRMSVLAVSGTKQDRSQLLSEEYEAFVREACTDMLTNFGRGTKKPSKKGPVLLFLDTSLNRAILNTVQCKEQIPASPRLECFFVKDDAQLIRPFGRLSKTLTLELASRKSADHNHANHLRIVGSGWISEHPPQTT